MPGIHGKITRLPLSVDPAKSGLKFEVVDASGTKYPFEVGGDAHPEQSRRLAPAIAILLFEAWNAKETVVIEYMDDIKVATGAGVPDGTYFEGPATGASVAALPKPLVGTVSSVGVFGRPDPKGLYLQTNIQRKGSKPGDLTDMLHCTLRQDMVIDFAHVLARARLFKWPVSIDFHYPPKATYPEIDRIVFAL